MPSQRSLSGDIPPGEMCTGIFPSIERRHLFSMLANSLQNHGEREEMILH